ncbi:MAG: hypothetical protein ACLUGY_10690 [Phocaeicola massiliensis]
MIKKIVKKGVSIALAPINKIVKRTNWYKNVTPEWGKFPIEKWYRTNLDRNYDIVNVGSSSALYAFNYEGIPVKAFNWAMQPQSMEYSFRILKNFSSILGPKGIILIPLGPFSGLSVTGKWTERLNDRYYGILDPSTIDSYNRVALRRKQPFLADPKNAIKRLIKDEKPKHFPNCSICLSKEAFENDAQRWMNGWQKEFGISDVNAPKSKENVAGSAARMETFKQMIDFCLERDLRPVLVMPPVHPALAKKINVSISRNIHLFIC